VGVRGTEAQAVRAALAEAPAWTTLEGPGRTHAIDVRPITRAPRVRWHLADPEANAYARQDGVLGGPLGLITARGALAITVLDPETGAVRATTPVTGADPATTGGPPISLAGEVMLLRLDNHAQVRAVHAWDDVDLHQVPLQVARDEVVAWELSDPLTPPGKARALTLPRLRHDHPMGRTGYGEGLLLAVGALGPGVTKPSFWIGDSLALHASRELVLASLSCNNVNSSRLAALDRASGAVRWTAEGTVEAFDAQGVAAEHLGSVTLHDAADGAKRWTHVGRAGPDDHSRTAVRALGADLVALQVGVPGGPRDGPRLLRLLDRESGTVLGDAGPIGWDEPVALARDVLYRSTKDGVAAHARDGTRLWSLDLAALARAEGLTPSPVHALTPMTGRLVVKTRDGTVLCLEG